MLIGNILHDAELWAVYVEREICEAQRIEACAAIGNVFPLTYVINYLPSAPPILMAILDNRCTRAELRATPKDAD